ncbi:DNA polymerase III subunit delta [Saprospiraceae bacterium]|nr:DNA polymerase III subunit delta [Saprospiraceae bacterium]
MQKILSDIKAGNYAPVYLFHGEEPYFIDQLSNVIETQILDDGEKAFNQMIMYGKETQAQQVIDACAQFPMMASHRVIILKEAQQMRDLKNLEKYVKNPSPSTILCICHKHKKLDTRTAFGKFLKANAVVFDSAKIYDNKVPGYVDNFIKAKKRIPTPQACKLIAEYIGADLSTLHNELEKLFLIIPEGGTITDVEVQKQIGISKEYNVFELQTAIASKDIMKAFRIAKYFQNNPKKNPMIMVVSTLFRFFSKAWVVSQNSGMGDQELGKMIGVYSTYFVKDYRVAARNFHPLKIEQIFGILKEYDLKSKGVENRSYPENTLVVELVGKILA